MSYSLFVFVLLWSNVLCRFTNKDWLLAPPCDLSRPFFSLDPCTFQVSPDAPTVVTLTMP